MQKNDATIHTNLLFSKISWLSASSIFKYCIQFITILLLANKLTLAEYGLYQTVWILLNVFSVTLLFGFTSLLLSTNTSALYTWIMERKKMLIGIVSSVLLMIIFYLFFVNNVLDVQQKLLLSVLIFSQATSSIGEAIIIKQGKEKLIFWINTVYFIGYFIIHYFGCINKLHLTSILFLLALATILKTIVSFLFKDKIETNSEIREYKIGIEWINLGLNEMLSLIVKWLDKWIILLVLPTTSFAIYFNGTYEIPIFMLLLVAVGNISIVEISKLTLEDTLAIKNIFERPIIFLAIIVMPSFAFLLFNAGYLFELFFAKKYDESLPIFMMTIFILPSRIIYSTSVLQSFNKSNIIVRGVLLDLAFAILLMLSLYPFMSLRGLALAFVISNYVQVYYYLWHTSKLLKQKITSFVPFKEIITMLCLSLLLMFIIFYFTKNFNSYIALGINSIACIGIMGAFYFLFGKQKNE